MILTSLQLKSVLREAVASHAFLSLLNEAAGGALFAQVNKPGLTPEILKVGKNFNHIKHGYMTLNGVKSAVDVYKARVGSIYYISLWDPMNEIERVYQITPGREVEALSRIVA